MIQKISSEKLAAPDFPYHRPNDQWVEVPSDSDDQSPPAVVRKPSLRSRRRNFTAACTAFTLGTIFIISYSPFAKEFFAPGPLSSHHSPLLVASGADRCAACHANANGSMVSWIADTFTSGRNAGLTQSALCMKCHEQSLAGGFALNPHNVDPNELKNMTQQNGQVSYDAGMAFHPPVNEENRIACSACHQEHHGERDMKKLTDAQCQTCHSNTFQNFESNHPEFVNYPHKRRSRIAFDHATHEGMHFPDRHQTFRCNQCHLDDAFQNVKKLASFEQSCAECHDQQILNSGEQGLAILALPMIDTNAIEAANLNVGSWPLAATGDFDGNIPSLMRVMLAADPKAKKIFQKVGSDFEFSDVDPTNRDSVQDAVELVWAIKRLFHDLSLDGPRAVHSRMEQVLGVEISDQRMQQIISNLDEPVFRNAVRRWLPDLSEEVANNRARKQNLIAGLQKTDISWRPDESGELMNIDDSSRESQIALPIVRVPKRHQDGQERQKKWSANIFADPNHDPDLLAVNPLKAIFEKMEQPEGPVESNALPTISTPAPPMAGMIGESPNRPPVESDKSKEEDLANPQIVARQMIMPTGWYRNDQLFRISYRPSGHADPCIQNWIELVTQATDADTRFETKQLFEKTLSMRGVGLCRTCHTLDQLPDRTFLINWRAEYRDPAVRPFTRFAHGPHLLQPELQDCSHCHQLDREARNAESFLSVDASQTVSNFMPISKNDCAACHQKGRTGNGCTQCHNYHVGSKIIGQK